MVFGGQLHHFFQILSVITAHLISTHRDSKVCSCVASLSPNNSHMTFYKNGQSKEVTSQQRWNAAKKLKVIMLEVKLAVFRFENGDSKAKIGWDLGLHDTDAKHTEISD